MLSLDFIQQTQYKMSLEDFLINENITHMITINSNTHKMGSNLMNKSIHKIFSQASSHVYKKNPIREKIFYISLIEKNINGNTHSHILFTLPENPKEDYFFNILRKKAKINIPTSSVDIQPITNMKGAIDYCTKDIFKNDNFEYMQFIKPFKMAASH